MASGIYEFNASSYLQAKIEFSATKDWTAENISANSAPVTAILYARRTNNYTTKGKSWSGYIKIAYQVNSEPERTEQKDISFSSSVSVGNSWVEMARLENVNVVHDTDGSQSITISGSVTGPTGTALAGVTSSGSQTVALDNIPRASEVTCADGNIGSATTININRVSTGFTHTLRYEFEGLIGTIATKIANTSWGWIIPTSFYEKIPNTASGSGKIYCDTYNGEALLGTKECSFNCFVVNSNPEITGTIIDTNEQTIALTGSSDKLIKYYSNVKVTMNSTAKNSATIKSQKTTCSDGKSTTESETILYGVESGIFDLVCIDSRGLPGTDTIEKEMVQYIKPAITSINIERENSVSNTIIATLSGMFFNESFGAQDNELTLKWRYRVKNGEWGDYTEVEVVKNGNTFSYSDTLGTDFDFNKAYDFEFLVIDKLATDPKQRPVTRGIPLIDLWEENVKVNGILHIFPVGAIYISTTDVNPATFLGGTWERIKDTFLLASGDIYANGTTGGEATHTLTENEMPSHKHKNYVGQGDGGGTYSDNLPQSAWTNKTYWNYYETDAVGGGQPHNNMPPYLAVYIWKRTA